MRLFLCALAGVSLFASLGCENNPPIASDDDAGEPIIEDAGSGEQDAGSTADGGSPDAGTAPCGDGVLDLTINEQCDDGNTAPQDGCSATCFFEPVGASCGNGMIEVAAGEKCDDGNLDGGDACNPTCNFTNTVSVFAGSVGNPGSQDGVGTQARFGAQMGGTGTLAVDQSYLWVADTANHSVRRIDLATAAVVTVAGTGSAGNTDNAIGTMAALQSPNGIATDGTTVWVGSGRRIRAISTTAPYAVSTVAGSGQQGAMDGVGAAATFDDLRGLTYFNGKVYLLDANAAVLRSFDPVTNAVTTIAGAPYMLGNADGVGSAARFTSPRYMTSDSKGRLYIVDTNANLIRTYDVQTGLVGTFVGGPQGYVDGVGAMARLARPRGLAADGTSVYWAEQTQHTLRQGVLSTGQVTTLAGQHCNGAAMCMGGSTDGVGTQARFDTPWDLAFHFPSRSLFVFDSGNAVIRRIQ